MRSASRASPSTASTCGAGLGLPRLVGLEVGVGGPDQLPRGVEGAARLRRRPTPRRRRRTRVGGGRGERAVGRGRRPDAAALRCRRRWRRGPAGCRGCWRGRSCSGRPGPRSVKSPSWPYGGVGEHVVAEAVDADVVDEVERVDDVARRLAHLLAADQQPAADRPALRAARRRPTSASPASTRSGGG